MINTIQFSQSSPAMISFVAYLTLVMMVGVVAFMLTRTLSDYVLGGRRLGGAVAALAPGRLI